MSVERSLEPRPWMSRGWAKVAQASKVRTGKVRAKEARNGKRGENEQVTKVALETDRRNLTETAVIAASTVTRNSNSQVPHARYIHRSQTPRVSLKFLMSLLEKQTKSRGPFFMACKQNSERQQVELNHWTRRASDDYIVIGSGAAVSAAPKTNPLKRGRQFVLRSWSSRSTYQGQRTVPLQLQG